MFRISTDSNPYQYLRSKPNNPQHHLLSPLEQINREVIPKASVIRQKIRNNSAHANNKKHQQTTNESLLDTGINFGQSRHDFGSEHHTCDLREQRNRFKGQRIAKSRQNSEDKQKSFISQQQHLKLFGKVTIHCLKANRERLENDSKSLESEYKYMIKKIGKMKKQKQIKQMRQSKKQYFREQKRKLSQQMKNIYISNQDKIKKRNQLLKQSVISHRFHKETSLAKTSEQKIRMGSNQRLIQSQLHQYIDDANWQSYAYKKQLYSREKRQDQIRKKKINKKMETRKLQAKVQFRQKWLNEFDLAEESKLQFYQKREYFANKIKTALDLLSQCKK